MNALLTAVLVVLACFQLHAKPGPQHVNDLIDCVFNAEKSPAACELSKFISEGMDMGSGTKPLNFSEQGSLFLNTVRQDMGGALRGFGEHRALGHWAFDGSIPREYFNELDELIRAGKIPANAREIFRSRWQEFVLSRTEAVKQVFGLSGPNSDRAARAFASMMNDVHCLGDHTTSATKSLRSVDETARNYLKSANSIIGNNNGLTKQIQAEISQLPKDIPQGLRAERILEILKSNSPELYSRIETVFGRMGFDGTLHGIDHEKINELLNVRATEKMLNHPLRRVPGIKGSAEIKRVRQPVLKKNFSKGGKSRTPRAGTTSQMLVPGLLSRDGRLLVSLKTGASHGLMVFAIEGGCATYSYVRGDIGKPEFQEKLEDAAIKGGTVGASAAVAVLLGAVPGGWVVLSVSVGAYEISDFAVKTWRESQKRKYVTVKDLEPFGIVPETTLELEDESLILF